MHLLAPPYLLVILSAAEGPAVFLGCEPVPRLSGDDVLGGHIVLRRLKAATSAADRVNHSPLILLLPLIREDLKRSCQ